MQTPYNSPKNTKTQKNASPKSVKSTGNFVDLSNYDKVKKMIGKKTKTYDLDDKIFKIINVDGDIVIKLLENNKGVFVDIRKYYKGYPTKRGVRIIASKFKEAADILKEDIDSLVSIK